MLKCFKISILIVCICVKCFAQKDLPADSTRNVKTKAPSLKSFIIKTDLFWPAMMYRGQQYYWSLTVEKMLAKRHSVQLTYMDGRWDFRAGNGIDRLVENKEHFFLVIPEYKFFVSKKKLCSGYYLGASLMYMQDRSTDISRYPATATNPASNNYSTGVSNGYGAGLFNGVQFYIFGRITVDIQAGMMFYDLYYEGEDYGGDWFPRLAFNLGYRFGLGEKKLLERKPKPKPVEIPWD